jgi:hypothetical protein
MAGDISQVAQQPAAGTAIDHLIVALTSPSATAIGWVASLIGLILGAIPLFLYVQEKRSNEAIKQLAEEFNLNQKVRERLSETQAEKKVLEEESAKLLQNVQSFEQDIKERLPREAKIAFLKNAIPALEEQIYALVTQKESMTRSLTEMGGATFSSPAAMQILSAESETRLSAKRQIETLQIQLSILTGLTSIVLYVVPYPADRVIVVFLAIPVAMLIANIIRLVRYVYPEAFMSRLMKRAGRRPYLYVFLAFVTVILLCAAIVVGVEIMRMRRF